MAIEVSKSAPFGHDLTLENSSCRRPASRRCACIAWVSGLITFFLAFNGLTLPVTFGDWLRAGFASTDITPTDPVMLAGYASRTNLSRGVHDPLSARVIAFDANGHKLVLASIDNLGFYNQTADPLRLAILEACHIQPSELLLCAIHTHSAPELTLNSEKGHANNVAYTLRLKTKLADTVRTALNRLEPVQVGVGVGSSPVGANRREEITNSAGVSKIVLGRNPSVLTDREVQVLQIRQVDRPAPSALLFAYSTHSTALGPRNDLISGDIHGLTAQFLENYFSQGVVAADFAGASGDVDPWVRVLPGFKTTNGWIPEPILMATLLGEEVVQVVDRTQTLFTNGPVKSLLQVVQLPGKGAREAQPPTESRTVPFTISVGCVGDVAFVGLGGEVFNEIGKTIKSNSPFSRTFIFTHCNGAAGYVPTRSSYADGGYEVESSSFGPGAGERIADEAVRMLRDLR